MNNDENKKKKFKVIGFALVIIGGLLMATSMIEFFMKFGTFQMPRLFFLGFIGIPMLGVGSMILKFAYMGKIARYTSNEVSPVIKDTANYLLEGTRDSIA
ncbi:MAG: hypothetical protein EOM87_04805, partial [Clostridia bacterium]|nr:hypothetical protein [Clostridia bacterium]